MMKKRKDKSIKSVEKKLEKGPEGTGGVLTCVRDCEIPGYGVFKVGDIVKDTDIERVLSGHTFFQWK